MYSEFFYITIQMLAKYLLTGLFLIFHLLRYIHFFILIVIRHIVSRCNFLIIFVGYLIKTPKTFLNKTFSEFVSDIKYLQELRCYSRIKLRSMHFQDRNIIFMSRKKTKHVTSSNELRHPQVTAVKNYSPSETLYVGSHKRTVFHLLVH